MLMRRQLTAVALALALVFPALAAAQAPTRALTIPVVQNLTGLGTFTGQLAVDTFKVVDGQLTALGTLTGRVTDTAGNLIGTVATTVALPVATGAAATSASCTILHLVLGPLDLNLLGLQVHLNQVVLDITAQQGPGNLLGNLLCSIANLLNGGPLTALANALNQLIAAL